MDTHYDIIIIGSGLGGLTCGYILAKEGYKVAIVEKNHQIGGCLQTFKRKGVKFDTGMHYIGSMQEGQILHSFFNYLNLLKDVELSQLDPKGFDTIFFQGEEYKFANGYEQFVESLAKHFPYNRKELETYVQTIQKIVNTSPLYKLDYAPLNYFMDVEYIKTSVNQFIESIISNPLLQNILAGNMPLYAGVYNKTSVYIYALVTNFYIESAYRIVGGSDSIANSLAHSIRSFGGTILSSQEVTHIVCDEDKAKYILLKNGEKMIANSFISNVHPSITLDMIDGHKIRKAYKKRIQSLENTISNFTLYLKFKENEVPYLNTNYYYYDIDNVWKTNDYDIATWPNNFVLMHQCHTQGATYAKSAEIIGYMNFKEVKKWEHTTVGQRGDAYLQFKEEKSELLLQKLEQVYPNIRDSIDYYEASTPLTYRDYTATKEGSLYGILRDVQSPVRSIVSQRTKIPNLYLTGQNINFHGILGVIIGAFITCSEFVDIYKLKIKS